MAKTSGTANLAELVTSFGPMFLGRGDQVTRSTVDDNALAAMRGISSQALMNANNAETETADIVSRIITKNAIAFAPVKAGARIAGLYNDTVTRQLAGEAQANSTAEASKAVLDYRAQQMAIAERANANILNATRGQVVKQKSVIPPNVTKLGGLALLGYGAYKNRGELSKLFESKEASDVIAGAPDPLTGEYAPFGEVAPTTAAMGNTGSVVGINSVSSQAGEELDAFNSGATNIAARESANLTAVDTGSILDASQVDVISGGGEALDLGGDAAATAVDTPAAMAADVGGAASDALTGIPDFTDGTDALLGGAEDLTAYGIESAGTAADVASAAADAGDIIGGAADIADGVDAAAGVADAASAGVPWVGPAIRALQGDFGGAAGSLAGGVIGQALIPIPGIGAAIGSMLGGAVGGGSIICTELRNQGRMSMKLWAKSMRHFSTYSPAAIEAYQILAAPFVRHLQKAPFSELSKKLGYIFINRAKWIAGERTLKNAAAYALVSTVVTSFGLTVYPVIKLIDKYRYMRLHMYWRGIGVIR